MPLQVKVQAFSSMQLWQMAKPQWRQRQQNGGWSLQQWQMAGGLALRRDGLDTICDFSGMSFF